MKRMQLEKLLRSLVRKQMQSKLDNVFGSDIKTSIDYSDLSLLNAGQCDAILTLSKDNYTKEYEMIIKINSDYTDVLLVGLGVISAKFNKEAINVNSNN